MRDFANFSTAPWFDRLWAELGLALGAGLILAILGPFGTFDAALLGRMGYWVGLCALWFVLAGAFWHTADLLGRFRDMAPNLRLALTAALTAGVLLAVVFQATAALEALDGVPCKMRSLLTLYPKVLVIGAGLSLLSTILMRPRTEEGAGSPGATRHVGIAPLSRFEGEPRNLPPSHQQAAIGSDRYKLEFLAKGPVLCLEMEDHYVRVHGEGTSQLILMRMADAVEAMGPSCGSRVHRSWWVANAAVEEVVKSGRNISLRLKMGMTVPVSQSYRRTVLDAFGPPVR